MAITVALYAWNQYGHSPPALSAVFKSPPSAPTAVTARQCKFTTRDGIESVELVVAFKPPADGGAPVTHFVAMTSPEGAAGECSGDETSITLHGHLSLYGTYSVKIRAVNTEGGGTVAESDAVKILPHGE